MRYNKTILVVLLFMVGNLYSQLDISLYTNKSNYEYGEKIELSCKITNLADTTFQFFAGTYQTCQAEFSFNDFNSWEHTACLATTELLTFEPYSSKIYTWLIDPKVTGLPNNEGTQQIIGTYYFDLVDTIYIETPQFLGGQLNVGYLTLNESALQQIRDSLNVEVLYHYEFPDKVSETWQVLGYQIDSIISRYNEDTVFNYVEKNIFIQYESIWDENPLEYFPLQIGNRWQYSEGLGEVLESKAIGDTTMSNSLTYIKVQGVFFRGYFRKENSRIYSYDTLLNEEELIYDFSLKVGDTLSVKVIDQDTIVTTVSSEGIAPIFGEDRKYMTFLYDKINSSGDFERKVVDGIGFVQFYGEVFSYGLTGAVIDSVSYGNIGHVEKPNKSIPNKYSLSQNYPNPFNPSTTIKYSIPNVGVGHAPTVQLKVYDVLGREVATLVNKEQSAGNYEVQFDASGLTSGIYLYQLQSGNFIESRKMILIK